MSIRFIANCLKSSYNYGMLIHNINSRMPRCSDLLKLSKKQGVKNLKIHESAENYLETILVLSQKKPQVRSIDIVNELEFSKPSVSIAMKNLRHQEYIIMDQDGYITLTDAGRKIAETIYERHTLLTDWLTTLGVDNEIAAQDACRIEHVLSPETFEAIKQHVKKR